MEFEFGGFKFSCLKIDVMQQFHIVRKCGPLLAEFFQAMPKVQAMDNGKSEAEKFEELANLLAPIMTGLSRLSDQDSEFVLLRLLSAAQVYQPQFSTWAKVASPAGVQMQAIELPVMLMVAGRVFAFNLSNFFSLAHQQGYVK